MRAFWQGFRRGYLQAHLAAAIVLSCGCAGTTPQDLLPRVGTWLQRASMAYTALDSAYMTLCFQREQAPECVALDEHRQALQRRERSKPRRLDYRRARSLALTQLGRDYVSRPRLLWAVLPAAWVDRTPDVEHTKLNEGIKQ